MNPYHHIPSAQQRTTTLVVAFVVALILSIVLLPLSAFSQLEQGEQRDQIEQRGKNATTTLTGSAASKRIPNAEQIDVRADGSPAVINFAKQSVRANNEIQDIGAMIGVRNRTAFKANGNDGNDANRTTTGSRSIKHHRYQQTFQGVAIEGSDIRVHERDGFVTSINGRVLTSELPNAEAEIADETAFQTALQHVSIARDNAYTEARLDNLGSVLFHSRHFTYAPDSYRLAYRFDIYAANDALRAVRVYVDAANGDVLDTVSLIHNCFHAEHSQNQAQVQAQVHSHSHAAAPAQPQDKPKSGTIAAFVSGTGTSYYNGTVPLSTEFVNGSYRLRGVTQNGGKIETYNAKNMTTTAGAVDFTDADNNFTDEVHKAGVGAHFGAEKTYEYFFKTFGRNSINNNGMVMKSYAHFNPVPFVNAFWNGTAMHYGDGNMTTALPLVALDIVAHEFTHGVTGSEAGLIYNGESGALNESFSDIFGAVIEFDAQNGTGDWSLGEDIYPNGGFIRSMSTPNLRSHPDTYYGSYWRTSTSDNNGVHSNSGVQNYWFYLLCNGGTVTNDFGKTFTVQAIGRIKAAKIAYETLTNYLTSSSDYFDARAQSEAAAKALFGTNSAEFIAVQTAWKAVGVDAAQFTNTLTPVAQPAANITSAGFLARWAKLGSSTSYQLDISTVSNFSSFVSGYQSRTIAATQLNHVFSTGLPGTTYYYRIRAVNSYGVSPHSNVITVTTTTATTPPATTLAAPIALPASNVFASAGKTNFTARWNAVVGATGYRLDVSANANFTSLMVNNMFTTALSYTATNWAGGQPYYYRVRAVNSTSVSANSNVITVATTATTPPVVSSSLSVSPQSLTVAAAGQLATLAVSANVAWTASASQPWVTVTPASGTGNGTLTLNVQPNTSISPRSAVITVKGGGLTDNVIITQAGVPAMLLTNVSQIFAQATVQNNGDFPVNVTANVAWTASANQSWVTVTPASGTGNASVTIKVQNNTATIARTALVTFAGGGMTKTVTIYQTAAAPSATTLNVNVQSVNAVAAGTNSNYPLPVSVVANVAWTVVSNQPWVTLTPTSGTGNGAFSIAIQANPTTVQRMATVTITGGGITRTIPITQAAASAASLALSQSALTVAAGSFSTNIGVASNVAWTASANQSWMTVAPASGTGNGTLTLNIQANTSTSPRTGTIAVGGGGIVKLLTIVQAGAAAPAAASAQVSGRVTLSNGAGVPSTAYSFRVAVEGKQTNGYGFATSTPTSNGYFTFSSIPNGTYTVKPLSTDYTYTPAQYSITVNGSALTNLNFVATPVKPLTSSFTSSLTSSLTSSFAASSESFTETAHAHAAGNASVRVFPNPAPHNGSLSVELALPTGGATVLHINDALGREVAAVPQGVLASGTHNFTLGGTGVTTRLASGVYWCNVTVDGSVVARTAIIVN